MSMCVCVRVCRSLWWDVETPAKQDDVALGWRLFVRARSCVQNSCSSKACIPYVCTPRQFMDCAGFTEISRVSWFWVNYKNVQQTSFDLFCTPRVRETTIRVELYCHRFSWFERQKTNGEVSYRGWVGRQLLRRSDTLFLKNNILLRLKKKVSPRWKKWTQPH
jgi:hypothetical protein